MRTEIRRAHDHARTLLTCICEILHAPRVWNASSALQRLLQRKRFLTEEFRDMLYREGLADLYRYARLRLHELHNEPRGIDHYHIEAGSWHEWTWKIGERILDGPPPPLKTLSDLGGGGYFGIECRLIYGRCQLLKDGAFDEFGAVERDRIERNLEVEADQAARIDTEPDAADVRGSHDYATPFLAVDSFGPLIAQTRLPGSGFECNSVCHIGERRAPTDASDQTRQTPTDTGSQGLIVQYVTMDQMAAVVNKSKRTLERWPLPPPDVKGGNGRANEWIWSKVRSVLEDCSGRSLPERFPRLT